MELPIKGAIFTYITRTCSKEQTDIAAKKSKFNGIPQLIQDKSRKFLFVLIYNGYIKLTKLLLKQAPQAGNCTN